MANRRNALKGFRIKEVRIKKQELVPGIHNLRGAIWGFDLGILNLEFGS